MVRFKQSTLSLVAVLLGLVMVAASLYVVGAFSFAPTAFSAQRTAEREQHIYGNPQAPTVIVEFSDYECPFCAQLHPTLKRIVDESDGQIAWEYRHLPLTIHPHARTAAVYAECVANLQGNATFWEYGQALLGNQQNLTEAYLKQVALRLGTNESDLQACVESDGIAQQIEKDMQTAQQFGGSGTPFSVIIFPDGVHKPISGALPYTNWMSVLSQ